MNKLACIPIALLLATPLACGGPPVPVPPAARCHVTSGIERVNFGLQGQALVDCMGQWAGMGLAATVTLQSAQSWVMIGGWQMPGHWKTTSTTGRQLILTSHMVLKSAYMPCKPNKLGNHLYRVGVALTGLLVRNPHTYWKSSPFYFNCG